MALRRYLHVLLLTFILISKEILVFNEEILVLFSFIIFLSLAYNIVTNFFLFELDLRSIKIQEEFKLYNETQDKAYHYLISYYSKQRSLYKRVELMFSTINRYIDSLLSNNVVTYIKLLTIDIDEKLKKIVIIDSKLLFMMQKEITSKLFIFLTLKHNNRNKKNSLRFLSSSISCLQLNTLHISSV